MLVAVTGTPGTGKSSVCDALVRRGYHVVDLDDAARGMGLTEAGEDGTTLVDVEGLLVDTRTDLSPEQRSYARSTAEVAGWPRPQGGPVGLEGLTTQKFVVLGHGEVRS